MPMKKTGKPRSLDSSLSSDQPGTSRAALEQMHRHHPAPREAAKVPSVPPPPKKMTYSMELFSTWRNIRWYQVPLSSLRRPKAVLFSSSFQSSLQEYQRLRKTKRLKVGRPFSVLPFHSFSSALAGCWQERYHKQHDHRRLSKAGDVKRSKRFPFLREEPRAFLQQLRRKLRRCRSSARSLCKRYIFCARTPGQKNEEQPGSGGSRSSTSRKPEPGSPGRLEQHQALEAPDPPRLLSCGSPQDWGEHSTGRASSPLGGEEDMFPPDWTPPRVDFLYDSGPPPLSPAPGSLSDSHGSGMMPDITGESAGLQAGALVARAPSPAEGPLLFPKEAGVGQPEERGSEDAPRPGCSRPCLGEVAEGDLGAAGPEDETDASRPVGLDDGAPRPFPIALLTAASTIFSGRTLCLSFDEFSGDLKRLTCDSAMEEDPGPDRLPALLTAELPTASSQAFSSDLSGEAGSLTLDSEMEEDPDDCSLVPLEVLLQAGSAKLSSSGPGAGAGTVCSSELDCPIGSLNKLPEEQRERVREHEQPPGSLGGTPLPSSSSEEVGEHEPVLLEAHRLILKQFSIRWGTFPVVHPGESIFRSSPYLGSVVTLDVSGLKPQNPLESLFFRSQPAHQKTLLRDGLLASLYCSLPRCPRPVRRWLFQLMVLNPDVSADAFQTLWEISVRRDLSADAAGLDPWCPELKDVTQAFCSLGACATALSPAGLLLEESGPEDLEFSEHLGVAGLGTKSLPAEGPCQVTLVAVLGNIFKFLTLCVASHPGRYPDRQRVVLLALLCRLSLDRNLGKQLQMELQQLLLVLLEGVRDWQEKLPELCRSLCHVSQHHHNLVAVVRSFADTTARGRQLRGTLSLCIIMKLLGKMQTPRLHWQDEVQLQQLSHLLPLMKPARLKQSLWQEQRRRGQPGGDQQEAPSELDQEAHYLCYSLLTLANVVVGTEAVPLRQQGHLQQLCALLQQHISAGIREDPCLMYRTELKDLAAKTYIKWQELLSRGWLHGSPQQGPSTSV